MPDVKGNCKRRVGQSKRHGQFDAASFRFPTPTIVDMRSHEREADATRFSAVDCRRCDAPPHLDHAACDFKNLMLINALSRC
ncbi:hypothetical protein [Burkholderia sp. 3C]